MLKMKYLIFIHPHINEVTYNCISLYNDFFLRYFAKKKIFKNFIDY